MFCSLVYWLSSPSNPIQTQAQCANSGVTAAQYGNVPDSPAQQYNQILGGNTALTPEKSNSWTIGAVIQPGVRVGRHCVIGANSVVLKDIPDFSVAVGVPARVIKRYDAPHDGWVLAVATDPMRETGSMLVRILR